MTLLIWLDRVARLVRPEAWTAGWLLGVAVVVLVLGRRRGRAVPPSQTALAIFLAGMSLAIGLAHVAGVPHAIVAIPVLLALPFLGRWDGQSGSTAPDPASAEGLPHSRGLLLLLLLAVGAVLSIHLETFAGTLLTWESSVIEGLAESFRTGVSAPAFGAERLLWQEGLVSSSHDSLLFGAPVYAGWRLAGPSLMSLRVVALLWAVVAVWALSRFGREVVGGYAGLLAAGLLAVNPLLFYYGRYGVSLSATLAVTVVAAWCGLRLARREPHPWWSGPLAGLLLFLATLTYSPSRLVVLTVLGLVAVWAVWVLRPFERRHILSLGLLALVVASVVGMQVAGGQARRFYSARGEQLLNFVSHPDYVREILDRPVRREEVSWSEKVEIVRRVVRQTLPQFLMVLAPFPRLDGLAEAAIPSDPPALPLLAAPLLPFALLGLGRSLRRWRTPGAMLLLAWFAGSALPLLLTSRADVHRMWLLSVPLTLWAADGLGTFWREGVMATFGTRGRWLTGIGLAAGLVVTCALYSFSLQPFRYTAARTLIAELERVDGPVVLGGSVDHREAGRVLLYLLNRARQRGEPVAAPLPQALLEGLTTAEGPTSTSLADLRRLLRTTTIVLAPAEPFQEVARRMLALGYNVVACGGEELRSWRLDRRERPVRAEPLQVPPGPEVALSSLTPLAVSFGFAPPQLDQAFVGGPLHLAGVVYVRGIGMHAWCRMTFPVPAGAQLFRSRVGLDDSALACDRAEVMISVLAEDEAVLFESELIDRSTPPLWVTVPVAGRQRLTLLVGEGTNGRDCDHVSWGDPVFVLKAP